MKHLSIGAMALLLSIATYAQQVKDIDFLNLASQDFKKTFNYEEKARVRIDNINRFIYKITVEKTDTDFNVTVPTALAGIKLPAFLNTQMPAAGAAPSPKAIAAGSKTAAQLSSEIDDNLKELIKVQQYMNKFINMHNKSLDISKSCTKTFTAIEQEVIQEMQKGLGNSNTTIPTLSNQLENDITTYIETAKKSYDNTEELLNQWEVQRKNEHRITVMGNSDALANLRGELTMLQAKLKTAKPAGMTKIQKDIKDKEKEIRDMEATIKDTDEDYSAQKTDMKEKVEKAKTLWTEIDTFREEGKVYTLVNNFKKVNQANYTYYSEQVEMKKDEVKFTFNIAANEPLPCNKPNEEKFEVTLRTKGGVKIDFSTGIFFNFGNDDFLGQEYYYKKVNGTESTIIAADAGNRVLLSLGALMHIYKRSPAKFKMGAGIGASTSTSFDAFNFHLGPTFIFGDKDRICLTVGLTLRESKLLDNRYQLNTSYTTESLPESVPTIEKFPVPGAFLSLTYNFSKISQ